MGAFVDRLKHGWNALFYEEEKLARPDAFPIYGGSFGYQSHRNRLTYSNERSIISSLYTRIGIDFAAVDMRHVRLDENDRYSETIDSGLNNCLTLEANIDQTSRAFKQDIVTSMFDKGAIAIVPVDTTLSPLTTGGYDILTMRVAEVVAWYPRHVRVRVYDDREKFGGLHREITLPKSTVAIVENPLYSVMNEPNSTLQRLIRKLNLLDEVDEQSASGKLDLIIQLPYVVKTEAKREQAAQRKSDLESQLKDSKYGIAYTDATEKITQLNRPAENNLLGQIEYLTQLLYSQLGLTKEVFDGTADEATMLNYYNRTIEPLLAAVTEAMKRTFLTKTARTQSQSIEYFRDPFKLVSVSDMAEIADKFTRNEVATSNDIRSIVGWRPSTDPKAEELRNKNLPLPVAPPTEPTPVREEADLQNGS
jgi:hypothetical protein